MRAKRLVVDIAVVIGVAVVTALVFLRMFELDISSKQLVFRFAKIKPFDNVVVRHDRVFYSDLLVAGLPGDTVVINRGVFYRNSRPQPAHFIRLYMIDLSDSGQSYDPENYPVEFEYFTYDQYLLLKKHVLINPVVLPQYFFDPEIYPYSRQLAWNRDFFGQMIVPHKGMVLQLNGFTYRIYKPLIEKYENKTLTYKDGRYYIGNKPAKYYKFRHNYYFVLNKLTTAKFDSRYWGPVPQREITGKKIWSYRTLESTITKTFRKIAEKLNLKHNG